MEVKNYEMKKHKEEKKNISRKKNIRIIYTYIVYQGKHYSLRNFFPHKSSNISDKNAISPLEDYKFSFLNANRALNLQFSSPHFFFCFFLFSFFSFLYLRRSAFTQINAYYVPECLLNSVTQPVWLLTSDSIKLRWGEGGR